MYGTKKPYPIKVYEPFYKKEHEIKDDNELIDLLLLNYDTIKDNPNIKNPDLKHSFNSVIKDNGLSGKQIMDRRTEQLIKLFKTRELKHINELNYHIFFEVVNLLHDSERVF